ncbi:hypothetical protein A9200_05640 [Maribacter hydrothermalis]|uniref:Uncharacterized protein n=1 Tax=Maribacter hydrothermalis TaxID=1836467 RepID=A0A1B7Z8W8_9FLAO|nr:hypothetical protein BTR34_16635 [Maribacter hydrothermalis]OBR39143.1 hypothetical protein A9200_05640 [Maribacter hydrothermalis]
MKWLIWQTTSGQASEELKRDSTLNSTQALESGRLAAEYLNLDYFLKYYFKLLFYCKTMN